jgi:hypothetical protein
MERAAGMLSPAMGGDIAKSRGLPEGHIPDAWRNRGLVEEGYPREEYAKGGVVHDIYAPVPQKFAEGGLFSGIFSGVLGLIGSIFGPIGSIIGGIGGKLLGGLFDKPKKGEEGEESDSGGGGGGLSSIFGLGSKLLGGFGGDKAGSVNSGGGLFSGLGSMFGFADGGTIPGYGDGDTVPAMLTPGEFVINKRTVGMFGPQFFHALQDLAKTRGAASPEVVLSGARSTLKFAEGGAVPMLPKVATAQTENKITVATVMDEESVGQFLNTKKYGEVLVNKLGSGITRRVQGGQGL